jgi:hypothetical protein
MGQELKYRIVWLTSLWNVLFFAVDSLRKVKKESSIKILHCLTSCERFTWKLNIAAVETLCNGFQKEVRLWGLVFQPLRYEESYHSWITRTGSSLKLQKQVDESSKLAVAWYIWLLYR